MKDLLEQVMPEFSPVPDRVEQVRRRARAARERLMWTGSAAAVLVVAAGAGVVAQTSPDQPAVAAASAACDLKSNGSPFDMVTSPVAPVGAAKVTLCIYGEPLLDRPLQPGDPGVPPTGSSAVFLPDSPVVPVPQRAGRLVGTKVQQDADGAIGRKVNAMPRPSACATSSGNYRLVFEFENQAPAVVELQDRCGHPIPREELLRGGDVLGWLDRMGDPYLVLEPVQPK